MDTSNTYMLTIEAVTAAGSVVSGTNSLTLANRPYKPAAVLNVASETNESQIKVNFGTVLPNNGGSPIISI